MGTLFKQEPRRKQLPKAGYDIAFAANELVDAFGLSFNEALKCIEIDHRINDYDVRDERLQGFGELLQQMIEGIKYGKNSID